MEIINLTPHPIRVVNSDGEVIATIAPSGTVARIESVDSPAGHLGEIPLFETTYGSPYVLLEDGTQGPFPDAREDTFLVVSGMLRAEMPERRDLLSPAGLVRDEGGRVTGTLGLRISR